MVVFRKNKSKAGHRFVINGQRIPLETEAVYLGYKLDAQELYKEHLKEQAKKYGNTVQRIAAVLK